LAPGCGRPAKPRGRPAGWNGLHRLSPPTRPSPPHVDTWQLRLRLVGRPAVTPGFKPNPDTHSMCAHESCLHRYCIENGYRITNVTIYSIYYQIMSLQKTKSNTLRSIVVERHHNSTDNRSGAIARLEHHIEVL
jgi:hypothetical protein